MVRTPALRLALLAVLVALGHLLSLEWLAREVDAISGLSAMAPPMYTRLLKPTAPPPVIATAAEAPAQPRVRAVAPQPPASSPEEKAAARQKEKERQEEERRERERQEAERQERERIAQAEPPKPEPEPPKPEPEPEAQPAPKPPPEVVAQAPVPAASEPVPAASAPASAPAPVAGLPSAPASAPQTATQYLDRWPADTRLSYHVTGEYRGPLNGEARVQWQREGDKYQVRLVVNVAFITQILASEGAVTPGGLLPQAYEEMRTGGKRRTAHLGDQVVLLEKGETVPRPPGVQDTASQFVELAQRFATGKDRLEVGRTVQLWLARPGGVDQWTYDVVERVMLKTPRLGVVEAYHLKPRELAVPRGNITAEMWFAPSLQYLPVRIKVIMGNEAWLDLLVEQIEQR